MKVSTLFVFLITIHWPLVSHGQAWTEEDWQPLVNEPSRQELLQLTDPFDFGVDALLRDFKFPEDTLRNPNRPRVYGLDISHYQPSNIDFGSLRAKNIYFVFAKATQGVGFKDPKFGGFWQAMGRLPREKQVLRGAYHFLSSHPTADPKSQAERFVAYVNLHGGFKSNDLSPVVDVEWDMQNGRDRWSQHTPRQIVTRVLTFMERVQELTGKTPMMYTARSWWRERRIPESEIRKFSRYPLWIADYSRATIQSENPRGPENRVPELWQFTDRATLTGGPRARFDGNTFDGDLTEFMQTFFVDFPLN